jgi:hypothetical protein
MEDKAMNTEIENKDIRELSINEIDNVSGGFLWIGVVVGAFLLGTGIRMGIDKAIESATHAASK